MHAYNYASVCNTIKCLVVITFCPCFLCLVPQVAAEMRVVIWHSISSACTIATIYVAGCLTRDRIFAEFYFIVSYST